MIRVAIDIRDLKLATTGSLTYLEAVVHEFKKGRPGFEFLFFDDSKTSYEYCGCNFSVAPINDARKDIPTIITISDNVSRENIIRRLKCLGISIFPNIISKNALVLPNTKLGIGNIVMPFVILSSNVHLGDFNIINSYSGLGHDSVLKSYCTLGPRVNIGGSTTIGNNVNIGQGSLIQQGLT